MDETLTIAEARTIKEIRCKLIDFDTKLGVAVILEDGTKKAIATIDLKFK